jgi:SAM-dependent methyltransferase/tRNA A-37 threonylcarbamoyl transferase component Bud32
MQSVTGRRTRVGPYEAIETAYVGGFSVVYRCRSGDQEIAVKAVREDCIDPRLARGLAVREARVRGRLRHAHALPLLEEIPGPNGTLLVGPWLDGGSLRERGPGRMPLDLVLALADGIGGALDELHASGWWHGDVSPGNVLFSESHPVLCDFGSSRRLGTRAVSRGTLVATPHVCAPEVWAGLRVDGRADLYSLGVLLYRALTGSWPFEAETPAGLAELHLRATPPLARMGAPLEAVLQRALAKDPSDRFSSGAELATAFRDAGPHVRAEPAAAEHLERFAADLTARERGALRVVLRRSAAAEARAWHETEQIAMQVFAPAGALLALEDCGAAAALASGQDTAKEIAAACGAEERPLALVLEFLATAGLLARTGDRYRLPPGPAALYAGPAAGRPLRESAAFWAQLSEWTATGKTFDQMDRPDGTLYARAATRARALAAKPARELAEALLARGLANGDVLDVGAGSAVWGLAIADATGGRLTALDRPLVLDVARANAESAGLGRRFTALAGDWRALPLPVEAFDVAVLANVCHLEPPADVARLLGRVSVALRPGGTIAVVDTMPGEDAEDAGALMQALHLALRTRGGSVHDAASYERWLHEAGFQDLEQIPLRSPAGNLAAMVGRRTCRR